MIVAIWTFSCSVILLMDGYDVLIFPYVIKPAIAGASKVIEKNLDDESNRKIVERFLSTVPATKQVS